MATTPIVWDYALAHYKYCTRHADVALCMATVLSADPNNIRNLRGRESEFFEQLQEFTNEVEQSGKSSAKVADEFITIWNNIHP
jgi:flagellar hook-basal body complex protein FliE